MLLSELLSNDNINSQLFAFFNTRLKGKDIISNGDCCKNFRIRSFYQESKFLTLDSLQWLDLAQKSNENLRNYSNLPFELESNGKTQSLSSSHIVEIQNDLKYSFDDYFNTLYKNIWKLFYDDKNDVDFQKALITAIFGLNGSADFKLNFYSVDIYEKIITKNYIDKYFKLILNLNQNYYLNLNFRQLQPEYKQGKKRSGQFRANLAYICENLEPINAYKIELLEQNKIPPLKECQNSQILQRFKFYLEKIVGKKNIDEQKLRVELGLDKKDKQSRNLSLKKLAELILPNECAGCSTRYPIENRSFKKRYSDEFYFEIHHNIPYANDKKAYDVPENLVKLCPTCHTALRPNRAKESYQKELIGDILKHSKEAREFAFLISQSPNEKALVDFIYENLR